MNGDFTCAVTGASGFVGRFVCAELAAQGVRVRTLVRRPAEHVLRDVTPIVAGDLEQAPADVLARAFEGVDAVLHLAGRAHVLDERAGDPARAYAAANRDATERVAGAAVRAGVPRFVLASSVKVNGESSRPGRPLRPDDPPAPADDYARSKLAAEQVLFERCAGSATEALVLRLPLVYGPGVGGNFLRLLDRIGAAELLPVGAIENRRSLLYVGNLADGLRAALASPRFPRGAHFVADARSVSTPELVRALGTALEEPPRIAQVPVPVLRLVATLLGRRGEVERLCGSLEVDARSFEQATGWHPAYSLEQGLARTAAWWRRRHSI